MFFILEYGTIHGMRRWLNDSTILSVMSGIVIVGVLLFCLVKIIPVAQVLWDEAEFLRYIQQTVYALQDSNLSHLLRVTRIQIFYPPLHTLLLALPVTIAGFSITNTRVMGLVIFFSTLLSIQWLSTWVSQELFPHWKGEVHRFISLISVVLYGTGPVTLILASLAQKELLSTLWGIIAVGLYLMGRIKQNLRYFFFTGLILSLDFLTKYQYPLFLFTAMLLELGIAAHEPSSRKKKLQAFLVLTIPFLTTCTLWIFLRSNYLQIVFHILNYYPGLVTKPWADPVTLWLYYPRAIIYAFHEHAWLGLITIPTAIYSGLSIKNPIIRFFVLCILVQGLPLMLNPTNPQERYLATSIPFFMVLSVIGMVKLCQGIPLFHYRHMCVLLGCSLALGSLGYLWANVPRRVYAIGNMGSTRGMLFATPDFVDNWFNYNEATWPKRSPAEDKETPHDITTYIANTIDTTIPYQLIGRANELSPAAIDIPIQAKKRSADNLSALQMIRDPSNPRLPVTGQQWSAYTTGKSSWRASGPCRHCCTCTQT